MTRPVARQLLLLPGFLGDRGDPVLGVLEFLGKPREVEPVDFRNSGKRTIDMQKLQKLLDGLRTM